MKIKKNLFKIATLSVAFTLGIGLAIHSNAPHKEVDATQYIGDYSPYVYSGTYYDDFDFNATTGMNGALRTSLTTLIKPKGFFTYSGSGSGTLSEELQKADQDPNNSSNMVIFYTRDSIRKTAAGSGNSMVWNREHVWCQSLSNGNWGESQGGTDLLHLRPDYPNTNSSRGNTPYGDTNKANPKYYDPVQKKVVTDSSKMLFGYSSGGYFEPLDCVKGDVARIIMYTWTTYTGWSGYSALNIKSVFQNYDTLLKWHTMDKPDALEGHRNDYVQSTKQKNRNPFVDHPELAWKVFNNAEGLSQSVLNQCMATYPSNGGDPIEPTGVSLNKTTDTISVNSTTQLIATIEPYGATGTVTWTSNNTDVATVNNSGLVTGVAEGNATITATLGSFSASCIVTVEEEVNIYGTLQDPLSINEAFEVIDGANGSTTSEKLYVKGTVSSNTAFNDTYQNYDAVWLKSEDGQNDNGFELYRTKLDSGVNGDYSDENSMANKEVVAYGYGKKYGSTYELAPINNAQNPVILSVSSQQINEKTPAELIEEQTTSTKLSYRYHKVTGSDSATDTFTHDSIGISGSTYASWDDLTGTSGVIYAGQSAGGDNTSGDAIQLRSKNSNSGIVVTSNTSGIKATSITVEWNTATASGRTIDVYGKDSAYSAPTDLYGNSATQGTKIGSIVYGTNTSLTISDDYEYIGFRSNNGALYLNSVEIEWGGSATTYTYSDVSIRFGGIINQELWNDLDTENHIINGFGVMITTEDVVDDNSCIRDFYDSAAPAEDNPDIESEIIDHYMAKEEMATPVEQGDNYVWNLLFRIDTNNLTTPYVAAAYIKTTEGYVFLDEVRYSVKTLAADYIANRNYSSTSAGGSLANLANLTSI